MSPLTMIGELGAVCDLTKSSLPSAQDNMKSSYDQKSVQCSLEEGDKVLVLLPVPGSELQAEFSGPYVIAAKLSDIRLRRHLIPTRKLVFVMEVC